MDDNEISNEEVHISTRTERALAYLDTWSVINDDGSFKTKVYGKEDHTDQYLHFSSNHPLEHKRGVVKTLMHRVDTIVSDERDKVEEKSYAKQEQCVKVVSPGGGSIDDQSGSQLEAPNAIWSFARVNKSPVGDERYLSKSLVIFINQGKKIV